MPDALRGEQDSARAEKEVDQAHGKDGAASEALVDGVATIFRAGVVLELWTRKRVDFVCEAKVVRCTGETQGPAAEEDILLRGPEIRGIVNEFFLSMGVLITRKFDQVFGGRILLWMWLISQGFFLGSMKIKK